MFLFIYKLIAYINGDIIIFHVQFNSMKPNKHILFLLNISIRI